MLNILFHYHTRIHQDKSGNLWTSQELGKFIDALAVHCKTFIMLSHECTEISNGYRLKGNNIELISLGLFTNVPRTLLNSYRYKKIINQNLHRFDCAIIRGSTTLLPLIARTLRTTPVCFLLGADFLYGISFLNQYYFKRVILKLYLRYNFLMQQRALKKALIAFVNGDRQFSISEKFTSNIVRTTITCTTVSEENFKKLVKPSHPSPFKLLYTGSLNEAKGIFELVEAIDILKRKNYKVHLDMIGPTVKNEASLSHLISLIAKLGLENEVKITGYLNFDPELLEFYRRADAFVIASYYEGFPRVIWEAMANSLPVIATKVGNIPLYLKNEENCLLINIKSPMEISEAVIRLINDIDLKEKLISQGYEAAILNGTLERKAADMIHLINEVMKGKNIHEINYIDGRANNT